MICRLFATRCLHLLQQRLLLLQQVRHLSFGCAAVGDVFDRQKNELVSTSSIEHLAGVQEHRAPSDNGKIPIDFVSLHHGVLGPDVFQQQPKFGDIPLAIAQPVNRTTVNVLASHPERLMEGAVCGDDAQVLIENKQGIADRIHDRLGQRARVIEIPDRLGVGERPDGCRWETLSMVRRFHDYPQYFN